ncbi:MAG: hypothetical protein KQI35_02590 [Bacteroidetes bacterium]|nr:hypothetical protein [Bacteroidota bacterium]
MKKYLYKGFYFTIPFLILFGFILVIDPYNFVNIFHVIDSENKQMVMNRNDESGPRGNMLWKILHYKRKPVNNILIGDSQCRLISEDSLKKYTHEEWFNFCIPGASYETMFDNFWFAAKHGKLQKVVFEVSFMNFNKNRSYSLSHFARDFMKKPYLYFTKKEILYDSWANLLYALTKDERIVQNSHEFAPEEDMNVLADKRLELFFGNYIYPDQFSQELVKITNYCHQNNIQLVFLIMPTYMEVHHYLQEKGLIPMHQKFKAEIKGLSETIDYDVDLEVSKKRENFIDYFHPRPPILNRIAREVWGNLPLPEEVEHTYP